MVPNRSTLGSELSWLNLIYRISQLKGNNSVGVISRQLVWLSDATKDNEVQGAHGIHGSSLYVSFHF